jgi:hypothetical protein
LLLLLVVLRLSLVRLVQRRLQVLLLLLATLTLVLHRLPLPVAAPVGH